MHIAINLTSPTNAKSCVTGPEKYCSSFTMISRITNFGDTCWFGEENSKVFSIKINFAQSKLPCWNGEKNLWRRLNEKLQLDYPETKYPHLLLSGLAKVIYRNCVSRGKFKFLDIFTWAVRIARTARLTMSFLLKTSSF